MTIALSSLFSVATIAEIYARGLDVARVLGLPVTSWRTGDPTKSTYFYLAEVLGTLEGTVSEFVKAGFLAHAEGDWLTVLAEEVYGVERVEGTFATPTVTITNSGGGFYPIEAEGDLIVKSSASNKTFRNTSAGTLSPGATVTFDLVADEAGSDSSVSTDEIDELVTGLIGCTIDSSTSSLATDEQDDASLKVQCTSTLGALSPDGPNDAYEYVARNPALTSAGDVTRARATGDTDTGDVVLIVAGPDGAVEGASITAVEDAIAVWATPLCVTVDVQNATEVTLNFAIDVEGDDLPSVAEMNAAVEARLGADFAALPISDGNDVVSRSYLISRIHAAIPTAYRVTLNTPTADTTLALGEIVVLGSVACTEI